jgi:hypothetical protein
MVNVFTTVDVSPTTKIFIRKKDKNKMRKRFSVSNTIVKNKRKLNKRMREISSMYLTGKVESDDALELVKIAFFDFQPKSIITPIRNVRSNWNWDSSDENVQSSNWSIAEESRKIDTFEYSEISSDELPEATTPAYTLITSDEESIKEVKTEFTNMRQETTKTPRATCTSKTSNRDKPKEETTKLSTNRQETNKSDRGACTSKTSNDQRPKEESTECALAISNESFEPQTTEILFQHSKKRKIYSDEYSEMYLLL